MALRTLMEKSLKQNFNLESRIRKHELFLNQRFLPQHLVQPHLDVNWLLECQACQQIV